MRPGLFMFRFVCHVAHEDPDQEVFRKSDPSMSCQSIRFKNYTTN